MSTLPASLPSFSKLHDLLNLLAELHNLSNPFDSPAALKSTLELVADFASILGINDELLKWLTDVESNAALLDLILSAGRFLESLVLQPNHPTPPSSKITIQSFGLAQLLPLIIELVQLLHRLRT